MASAHCLRDDAHPARAAHGLGPVRRAELRQYAAHVVADSVLTDAKLARDDLVGEAVRHQIEDLTFTRAQVGMRRDPLVEERGDPVQRLGRPPLKGRHGQAGCQLLRLVQPAPGMRGILPLRARWTQGLPELAQDPGFQRLVAIVTAEMERRFEVQHCMLMVAAAVRRHAEETLAQVGPNELKGREPLDGVVLLMGEVRAVGERRDEREEQMRPNRYEGMRVGMGGDGAQEGDVAVQVARIAGVVGTYRGRGGRLDMGAPGPGRRELLDGQDPPPEGVPGWEITARVFQEGPSSWIP
jgi:hypothetical protein